MFSLTMGDISSYSNLEFDAVVSTNAGVEISASSISG